MGDYRPLAIVMAISPLSDPHLAGIDLDVRDELDGDGGRIARHLPRNRETDVEGVGVDGHVPGYREGLRYEPGFEQEQRRPYFVDDVRNTILVDRPVGDLRDA